MSELALPAPRIWTPRCDQFGCRLRIPRWVLPWGKTIEDAIAEAIAIDVADIGHSANDASSSTIAFTTGSTVASNGFIVLGISWGSQTVTLSSVSGGSLTWAIDKQGADTLSPAANASCALVSAQAASGLASGTTITATFSAGTVGRASGGTSFTGVATSSALDTTSGHTDFDTTTAWTTASTTIAASSVLIACAHGSLSNHSSTITGPSVEAQDFNAGAGTFSHTVGYRIDGGSGGATTVAGTWSGNERGTVVAAAYKIASGGGGGTTVSKLPALGVG